MLAGDENSRRHPVIRPPLQDYILTGTSANGVWVNRLRVEGAPRLRQRDMIRVGNWELRFDGGLATPEPVLPPAVEAG